ncbi:DUF6650 family protein [Streptomyces swartbergensis]|uniref:DUF6650 family protein n=1 Tax=Streptomyces swartbergensis TaxID=487165 RepID=UPI0037F37873
MKALKIFRRIKGFSTPLGGLDWEAPVPQRAIAQKVIVYLEDRRVLTMARAVTHAIEVPDHCVASVLQIREALTQILMEPETGEELAEHLKAMRAACRRFLDTVGSNPSERRPHAVGLEGAIFGAALGELRAVFGIQLGFMASRYKLSLPQDLAAILPADDIDGD